MIRPTSFRLAGQVPVLRSTTSRRTQQVILARRTPQTAVQSQIVFRRAFADAAAPPPPPPPPPPSSGGGGGSNTGMWVVLAAIVALAAGGYVMLKPVSDVASATHQTIKSVKEGAGDAGESLSALAKSVLPPGVFSAYTLLANHSGFNGFLSNLKDKDIQGVLDEVKKHGNDDVKRIVEKVEKRVKDAKGKVQDVDWKALAEELKQELPEGSRKYIDMFIGKIPSKEDYDQFISKLKEAGEQKKKEIEAAASKVMKEVEKAKKDGKGQADAYIKGLKAAAPEDIDQLIAQIKETAKSAGLPADQIESWLKSKAKDGKVDAEALQNSQHEVEQRPVADGNQVEQTQSKLKAAVKFLPGEPKDLIAQVKQFSPSLADLLAQALKQADIVDDKLNRKA